MKNNLCNMNLERIRTSSFNKQEEFNENTALGKRFEADKNTIEQRIIEIQESHLAYKDKQDMILGLEAELEKLREQYDSEVDKKNAELAQYFQDEIRVVQEKIESLKESLFSIKEMNVEATSFDRDKASDSIREKQSEYEAVQRESKKTLKSIVKTMEEQKRNIRKKNYK